MSTCLGKFLSGAGFTALLLTVPRAQLDATPASASGNAPAIQHVLLISVDGMHAIDLTRFVERQPHSALAFLTAHGITYADASTPWPSDSFPGLLAMVTGGTPEVTGVFYDDSYDRRLSPPGSTCTRRGTAVVYNERIDTSLLAAHAGMIRIDPGKLPLDPEHRCSPVYPHQYLRVNTVFNVVTAMGGATAWADKHPSYEILDGPAGNGVGDLYTPEIGANAESAGASARSGITGSLQGVQRYDATKVAAVINEIDGLDHAGNRRAAVPELFGLNFQSLNVAQKLSTGGYREHGAVPSATVVSAMAGVDRGIGRMLAALERRHLLKSTLVIVSAKSGNCPMDRAELRIVDRRLIPERLDRAWPGVVAHITADDIMLIWLKVQARAGDVARLLRTDATRLGIERVYAGASLRLLFGNPMHDPRIPDVVVVPTVGTIYAKSGARKIAEHGGFHRCDTHVGLLLSAPGQIARGRLMRLPVSTMQIAPTILAALGINPSKLQAVRIEHTQVLPQADFGGRR